MSIDGAVGGGVVVAGVVVAGVVVAGAVVAGVESLGTVLSLASAAVVAGVLSWLGFSLAVTANDALGVTGAWAAVVNVAGVGVVAAVTTGSAVVSAAAITTGSGRVSCTNSAPGTNAAASFCGAESKIDVFTSAAAVPAPRTPTSESEVMRVVFIVGVLSRVTTGSGCR